MSTEATETFLMVAKFIALVGVPSWGFAYGAARLLRIFETASSITER